MKPTLFLLMGYPGSGKTYFSKHLSQTLHIPRLNSGISGQGIREFMYQDKLDGWPENNEQVYGALRYAANQILAVGHDVLFDASNSNVQDRGRLYDIASFNNARALIIWLDVPVETARRRAVSRDSAEETSKVPHTHFDKLVSRFQVPQDNEVYIKIDGTATFDIQLSSFKLQMQKITSELIS